MLIERLFLEALKPMKLQGSTGSYRKRQNLLADYDRTDASDTPELVALKASKKGFKVLSPNSAKKIIDRFQITDLSDDNPRNLGNTGITILSKNGKYYLNK